MPPAKYAKSQKFAALSPYERAVRIGRIKDKEKRKAAQRFWGLDDGGGSFLGAVGKVARGPATVGKNVLGDVPQLASAMYASGEQIGKAAYSDIRSGRGVWKPGGILVGESEGGKLAREMITGIPAQAKLLADPKAWYEDPLIQTFNLASFVLPAARAASVTRLARTVKAANPGFSKAEALKAATAESFHPGFLGAQGIKGGISPRLIKGKYGPEEGVRGRMPSRQPLVRGAQRGWDILGEAVDEARPGSRWSASSRAQRMAQRQAAAATRLRKAERAPGEQKIVDALLGPGAQKRFTRGQVRSIADARARLRRVWDEPGRTDRPLAAALIASLEAPESFGTTQAVKTRLRMQAQHLEEQGELMPMQKEVDDLNAQRAEALDADPDVDTSILDKQIFLKQGKLDVLLGRGVPELDSPNRTKVYNAMVTTLGRKGADKQIQQWDLAAWGNDLDNPTAFYDKVEVQRLADSAEFKPTGTALYQRNEPTGPYKPNPEMDTRERIQQMLDHGYGKNMEGGVDRNEIAASLVDEDEAAFPGGWEQVGFDRGAAVSEYLYELDDLLGPEALYQKMAAGQGGWYFPLQRELEALRGQRMSGNQLLATLRNKDVKNEELRNSLVANTLEEIGEGMVDPGEILDRVAQTGYFRRFDPNIEIETDIEGGYNSDTRFGPHDNADGPVLNSREGEPGDYFEMVVDMDELEPLYGVAEGEGAGRRHWGIPNNVYHVRGQIFHEDGVKKLLVEEIQPDWASDVRRAKKGGQEMVPSPMHESRYLQQAIHQIMRHADAENVDEVIVTTGNTQAVRNGIVDTTSTDSHFIEAKYYGAPGDEKAYAYHEFIDPEHNEPMTNDLIDSFLDQMLDDTKTAFPRLYDREIPGLFKKLYGLEGEVLDDAYKGRFTAQPEPGHEYGSRFAGFIQPTGDMRGTVIRLTDEAKAKARKEKALYQTDPAGEVKGATEFLADGRRRVTMFMGANATTWSHELIHVLTPDLSPEHRKVLETEIADGKPYEEWGTVEHEKLADAWDSYWRDGYAPPSLREVFADLIKRMKAIWQKTGHEAVAINPRTARTFDEMLGKRYHSTVVLDEVELGQVKADVAELQKALDSGDLDQLDEAVAALAELSHQAEQAGVEILSRGKTPTQVEALVEGLARRKNAVVEDYRRRGLIDVDEDAKGYFPHMSMWDSINQPPSDAVRMAATGDVVGVPKVTSKAIAKQPNRLIRMQTGEVLNDPAVITYILRARLRLQETIKAREELYAVGTPVKRGAPTMKDMVYVRDPSVDPEKMRTATLAANRISERDFRDLSARQMADAMDEINDVNGVQQEMFYIPDAKTGRPEWMENEDTVRVVPYRIAQNRLGDVFRSAPRGNAAAALGITNALFRIASIYARPWRYIPVNFAQNAVMLAITNPAAFAKLVKRDVARLTKDDPELLSMVREQVGTIQATALPEFNVRPQTRMQAIERQLTKSSGQFGEMLGRYADVPIREAAWLNHAGKYGFSSADEIRDLITKDRYAEVRETIAQRTKEDLIDFDTLTPYEKEVMTRYLALWPFIRGITKWPFMYAREYPARVAAASLATGAVQAEETDETVMDMGTIEMLGKRVNVGKLDPTAPGREMVQNVVALGRGVGQVANGEQPDLTALSGNYLTPGLREMLGMAAGEGRKNWTKNVARTFVPGVGIGLDVKKGGSVADQSLRQLGLIRERTDSVKAKIKEWMGPIDQISERFEKAGQPVPEQLTRLEKLRAPYGDWKQYESEVKFAHRDRGESDALTKQERVEGLLDVAEQHYPRLAAQMDAAAKRSGWQSFEQLVASGKLSEEAMEALDRALYDEMFGAMEDVKREAREAGLKVE